VNKPPNSDWEGISSANNCDSDYGQHKSAQMRQGRGEKLYREEGGGELAGHLGKILSTGGGANDRALVSPSQVGKGAKRSGKGEGSPHEERGRVEK